jgi:hypothetical protein
MPRRRSHGSVQLHSSARRETGEAVSHVAHENSRVAVNASVLQRAAEEPRGSSADLLVASSAVGQDAASMDRDIGVSIAAAQAVWSRERSSPSAGEFRRNRVPAYLAGPSRRRFWIWVLTSWKRSL